MTADSGTTTTLCRRCGQPAGQSKLIYPSEGYKVFPACDRCAEAAAADYQRAVLAVKNGSTSMTEGKIRLTDEEHAMYERMRTGEIQWTRARMWSFVSGVISVLAVVGATVTAHASESLALGIVAGGVGGALAVFVWTRGTR